MILISSNIHKGYFQLIFANFIFAIFKNYSFIDFIVKTKNVIRTILLSSDMLTAGIN